MTQENTLLDKEAPIFIMGAKRGGTTLLRRIIDAHPEITIPPPGWLYHFIYPYLYSYGDLTNSDNFRELVEDCLVIPMIRDHWNINLKADDIIGWVPEPSFRAVLYTLSAAYAEKKDKGLIWGSKSPGEAFWIREIKRDFPRARFVFITRDGRDVAADLASTIWGPRSLYSSAMNWRRHMEAILAARNELPPGIFVDLKYEDLVRNPEQEIEKLCVFLGVDYAPQMLNYHQIATDAFVTSTYHVKTNSPITDQYVGIHRDLPEDDLQAVESAIGDLLEDTGYESSGNSREVGFWEQLRIDEGDDHGGMMLRGGVELMDRLQKRRAEALPPSGGLLRTV